MAWTATQTEEQVKSANKKLALRLHPDKNKAPGEEAFKKVSPLINIIQQRFDVERSKTQVWA